MNKYLFFSILIALSVSLSGCFNDIPGNASSTVSLRSMQSLSLEELPAELTDYEFFELFDETMNNALSKITLLQNSGLDKLGEETQYGDISGTIHYKATFNFWKMRATVVITFTNYCDTLVDGGELMVLDDAITTISNTSGDGTVTGTINISGLYPGYVNHDLTITSQETSGGSYYVKQEGSEQETEIPWDYLAD